MLPGLRAMNGRKPAGDDVKERETKRCGGGKSVKKRETVIPDALSC